MANLRSKRWLLIYPKFQLQLVGLNALVLIGVFGFIARGALKSFDEFREMGLSAQLPADHVYFRFLSLQSSNLVWHLSVGFLLSFVLSTGLILVLSHRLAAPILRLHTYFSTLIKNEKRIPLKFRKRDFFSELPPLINEALDTMEKRSGE